MPRREGYTNLQIEIPIEVSKEFKAITKRKHLIMRGITADLISYWVEEQKLEDKKKQENKK